MKGAAATMALVPQIAVPAPIHSDVFGRMPNSLRKSHAGNVAAAMHVTVMLNAVRPTLAMLVRLRETPVSTMVAGSVRFTTFFAPSTTTEECHRLRTSIPQNIAAAEELIG